MTVPKSNQMRMRSDEDRVWELFHENSKTTPFEGPPPDDAILAKMARLWESLPFPQYPAVPLPGTLSPLRLSLEDAIVTRASARGLTPLRVSLADVATVLHHAYGVTRDNAEGRFPPVPHRAVGRRALPLESSSTRPASTASSRGSTTTIRRGASSRGSRKATPRRR